MTTYLDLIRNDRAWAELCADLVCPDRIKVYEAKGPDESITLHILKIAERGHITLVGIVLPIKLHGEKFEARAWCQSWIGETDRKIDGKLPKKGNK
jgi:hypothetical protein